MNEIMNQLSGTLKEGGFELISPDSYEKYGVDRTASREGMEVYHKPIGEGTDYKLIFLLPTNSQETEVYGQGEDGVTIALQTVHPNKMYGGITRFGHFDGNLDALDINGTTINLQLKELLAK